ncbi:MAG TPA: phosphatase PAP2 family protein [Sphingomicrobium sp.]|jgi:hypothetical protein|nr:phosphatase PAP2 family protein [Sphingomicrobium sp.]
MAAVYGPFWFISMLLSVFWALSRPPSRTKAAILISYFAVWSVFGPIGQAVGSSAGPIFYERVGLGDRFSELPVPALTKFTADYLWTQFEQRSLAPGAGISAMPSLHIASMAWMVIAFGAYRSLWAIPALVLTLYIYVGSIALGWHYATDGVVGALGALACFHASKLYLREIPARQPITV